MAQSPGPPLRLLFVGNVDSVHVRRWAGYFTARGHSVHAAGLGSPRSSDEEAPFVVHRLGRPQTAFLALRRLAQRLRSEVLHAHYLTYYGWMARASLIRPYVITLWGSDLLLDVPASRLRRTWAGVVLRGAACVTADSEEIISAAIRLGADASRTHEIQFGVDTSRFVPRLDRGSLLDALGLHGRRVLFSPRAVTPLYRTLIAVEALRHLPEDVVLVGSLAGADPGYVEVVKRATEDWGLRDRVRFLPSIPHGQIERHYAAASAVLSLPASDGTPVSVLEALAVGTPVVATDLPAVRSWLGGLGSRLLVPVDDVAATARAVAEALSMSGPELAQLAAEGRAAVIARGDQASNMERMEALYIGLARR